MRSSQQLALLITMITAGFATIEIGCGSKIFDDPTRRNPICGTTLPTNGAPCAAATTTTCQYDPDDFGFATASATCNCFLAPPCQWFVSPNQPLAPTVNSASCPAIYADAMGLASCPATNYGSCFYNEGVCGCTACGWRCRPRSDVKVEHGPSGATCPPFQPLYGDACGPDGVICHYEHSNCPPDPLDLGGEIGCFNGFWGPTGGGGGVGGCQQGC